MDFYGKGVVVLLTLLLASPLCSAEQVMRVNADVIGDIVSLSIPNEVFLGNVSRGFKTNESVQVTLTNTGNTDIAVTPELLEQDSLFSNLYFKRIQSESFKRIGEFVLNISRPAEIGGMRQQGMYMKLDLTDYTGSIDAGVNRRYADVRFIVTSV